jgi:tRNA(Ile)-lysidine synthase
LKDHQKTIEQEVINFIKRYQLLDDSKKILIALSGGADSVFALRFFNKYKKKYKIEIAAIHVNHNLRGKESLRDEKFCRSLCEKIGIEIFIESVNVKSFAKKNKLSIEEAARILRYQRFDKVLQKSNSDLIITAHNSDDNTESVLLNIVNGTGIDGISGISIKNEKLIRPFLCLSKNQITEYLENQKVDFVYDSTNEDTNFRRNYVRKEIIPLLKNINPSINKSVFNSSEVVKNQKLLLNYFIDENFDKIVSKKNNDIFIDLNEIKNFPSEILGEILKRIFVEYLDLEFNYKFYLQFQELISSQVGTKFEFNKNFKAIKERNLLRISRKLKIAEKEIVMDLHSSTKVDGKLFKISKLSRIPKNLNKQQNEEIISADNLCENLILRKWKTGDRIQLLGMKGTKKISDVLTDLKIPILEKEHQLVLVNNNEIVYLVGKRISEKYKVTAETKKVIKICLK